MRSYNWVHLFFTPSAVCMVALGFASHFRLYGESRERESVRMAVVRCANCGREVSASTPVCAGCGRPNVPKSSWVGHLFGIPITIVITAFVIHNFFDDNKGAPDPASTTLPAASSFATTASEIAAAYDADAVAADMKFKGQRFSVSGVVEDTGTDLFDNPYVKLKGGVNQFEDPQFRFDASLGSKLSTLTKGMEVTVICTGNGDIAKTPVSDHCLFSERN